MSDIQAEIDALDDEEQRVKDRLRGIYDDARAILREDLPKYVEREVKKRFITTPERAQAMSDTDVAALKEHIRTAGTAAAERILAALGDESVWLAGAEVEVATPRSFETNEALWSVVGEISRDAESLLRKHGFQEPEGGFLLEYRQPTWFVAGKHMGTISEHYWRAIRELQDLRARREDLISSRVAEDLKRRWDSI